MMSDSNSATPPEWVEAIRSRGLGQVMDSALDVLGPLGLLGAQLMWVAQPLLGRVISREALGDLAEILERPGGIEQLRAWLEERGDSSG
jgi:hypothetical protein